MIYNKEDSIGFIIHRTSRAFISLLNARFLARGYDLKAEHWSILYHLYAHGALPQQELGIKTCYDKTSVTRIIDHLVKLDMVTRAEDESDRRKQIIALTTYANEVQAELESIVMKEVRGDAMKNLNKTDEQHLKELLNRIYQNIIAQQPHFQNNQTQHKHP